MKKYFFEKMKNYVFHVKPFYNNLLLKSITEFNHIVRAMQRFQKRNHQIRHVKRVVDKYLVALFA
jgi:hypothetical protein